MSALRLARAATRRDRVIKFAGCYHGHVDALLASAGSGVMTLGIPSTPGVPEGVTADTIVCGFNDVDGVAAACARYGEGLAAIVVEPIAGNMGCVPPAPGFLEALRMLADATGALLVFDEVMTGFRVARGGAQERYGVLPDLTILGKIVGGGLPAAAFGGRADLMERLAPSGDVYQAGTLSGNPLATAAGVSVLRRLREPAVYDELERTSARLEDGLAPFGIVQRVGGMLTLFCHDGSVQSYEDAVACDTERFGALFRHLLAEGVYLPPSQFECLFPSLAHTDEDVDRTVAAVGRRPSGPRRRSWDLDGIRRDATARHESTLWGDALLPRRGAGRRTGLLPARRRRGVRARGRDDLRGLPAPLRPAAALRARRRRRRAPPRRLLSPTGSSGSPRPARSPPSRTSPSSSRCAPRHAATASTATARPGRRPAALLGRGGLDDARAALRDARDPAPLERLARRDRRATIAVDGAPRRARRACSV